MPPLNLVDNRNFQNNDGITPILLPHNMTEPISLTFSFKKLIILDGIPLKEIISFHSLKEDI